jgi:hypothetical protein
MKNKILCRYSWIGALIVLFGLVYQLAGTYVYVEGD